MNKKVIRAYSFAILCIILGGMIAINRISDHENTAIHKQIQLIPADENRLIGLYHIDSIIRLFEKLDYPIDKDKIIRFDKTESSLILSPVKKEEGDRLFNMLLHNSPVDSLNKVFATDKFSTDVTNYTIKFARRVSKDSFIYVPHFIVADALCH